MIVKQLLAKTGSFDFYTKQLYIQLTVIIYKLKYLLVKVQPEQFVFESFQGKSASDSPYALYLELTKLLPNANFVWVFSDNNHEDFQKLQNISNTRCVVRATKSYFQAYASSQYWIINCRLPYRLIPSSSQTVVQCWHGTPLKKLGLDIKVENHPTSSLKAMHFAYLWESKRCDYFLSPSPYASNCFKSSFGVSDTQILELGYPRNDDFSRYKKDLIYQNNIKKKLGIQQNKKVILYAPTFRDDDFSAGKHRAINQLDNTQFKEKFGDDVQFLFRGHYFSEVKEHQGSFFLNVSSYPRINDLLLIADAIITDYSSLFFDYLVLGRPIFFYMYDKDKYLNDIRGTYLDVDKSMPGPIAQTQPELLNLLLNTETKNFDLKHFNEVYNPYEDGQSSLRVIQEILAS